MYVTLQASLPVLAGRTRGKSNFITSSGYIAGTTLRGWAAHEYLQRGGSPQDTDFRDIFLDECLSFPSLYPTDKRFFEAPEHWHAPYPIPATARTCKAYPGFTTEAAPHGAGDRLFRAFLASRPGAPRAVTVEERCTRCDGALERLDGFCQRSGSGASYFQTQAKTRMLARTAIDRDLGTARVGMLYALEALLEGTIFTGAIQTYSTPADIYARQLFAPGAVVRLGGARTRGLGKLQHIAGSPLADPLPLRTRLERFNTALQTAARSSHMAVEGIHFSLTLHADLILLDPFLRYRLVVDAAALQETTLFEAGEVERVWHASSQHCLQGWNDALGVPKEDEIAITMGSVFLLRYYGTDLDSLAARLTQLEARGLGLRRGEGFGRLRVCDPFHWEVQEL